MFSNPFSPIFGGKPDVFFGREKVLNLFDHAMIDTGSDDRAIFITGTRGSGKTALLEQLSIRATDKKRKVIESAGSVSKTEHIGKENLQTICYAESIKQVPGTSYRSWGHSVTGTR